MGMMQRGMGAYDPYAIQNAQNVVTNLQTAGASANEIAAAQGRLQAAYNDSFAWYAAHPLPVGSPAAATVASVQQQLKPVYDAPTQAVINAALTQGSTLSVADVQKAINASLLANPQQVVQVVPNAAVAPAPVVVRVNDSGSVQLPTQPVVAVMPNAVVTPQSVVMATVGGQTVSKSVPTSSLNVLGCTSDGYCTQAYYDAQAAKVANSTPGVTSSSGSVTPLTPVAGGSVVVNDDGTVDASGSAPLLLLIAAGAVAYFAFKGGR